MRDNLLGTSRFCPIIRRTKALTEFLALDLAAKARETVGRTDAHLVARAASFVLLADGRASFEIEASARRATGWSDGAGRSCKPERTTSRWMRSSAFSASLSRTRDSYVPVCVLTAPF
jgi:hypothetical protein